MPPVGSKANTTKTQTASKDPKGTGRLKMRKVSLLLTGILLGLLPSLVVITLNVDLGALNVKDTLHVHASGVKFLKNYNVLKMTTIGNALSPKFQDPRVKCGQKHGIFFLFCFTYTCVRRCYFLLNHFNEEKRNLTEQIQLCEEHDATLVYTLSRYESTVIFRYYLHECPSCREYPTDFYDDWFIRLGIKFSWSEGKHFRATSVDDIFLFDYASEFSTTTIFTTSREI